MKPEKKTTRKKVNPESDSPFQSKKRPASPVKGRKREEDQKLKADGDVLDTPVKRPRKRVERSESTPSGPEKVFEMRRPLTPEERREKYRSKDNGPGREKRGRKPGSESAGEESRGFSRGGFNRGGKSGEEGSRETGKRGFREKKTFGSGERKQRPDREGGRTSSFTRRQVGGENAGEERQERPRKPFGTRDERPRKPFGEREERTRKPYKEREDRPRKTFGDRDERPKKTFGNREDRPKKTFGDRDERTKKPYGDRNDRPRKTFGDRDERPKKTYGDREERSASPFSRTGDRPYREEKPRKVKKNPMTKHEKPTPQNSPFTEGVAIRLNRYLSVAGICSRREADELIRSGKVTVNGAVVTEMGLKVTPGKDIVLYNKEEIEPRKLVYILLNKPKNTITTTEDPEGRMTVMDLIKDATRERVFPVGRLDRNTTGLLLLTNDGELAEKLTHPSHGIRKIYKVTVDKDVDEEDIEKMRTGFELEDGFIKADKAGHLDDGLPNEIGIEIHSGRNRIVRRMLAHLGYEVRSLDRVMFGPLTKKKLQRGWWRFLTPEEVGWLKML